MITKFGKYNTTESKRKYLYLLIISFLSKLYPDGRIIENYPMVIFREDEDTDSSYLALTPSDEGFYMVVFNPEYSVITDYILDKIKEKIYVSKHTDAPYTGIVYLDNSKDTKVYSIKFSKEEFYRYKDSKKFGL